MFEFFEFLRRPARVHDPSPAIVRALALHGGFDAPPGGALRVMTERGQYTGRWVTFIRVFDGGRARATGVEIRSAADLDRHPELVVRTGHVEQDGTVVLATEPHEGDVPAMSRTAADRSLHADDQLLVDKGSSRD